MQGAGFRVQGLGSGCRVQGRGLTMKRSPPWYTPPRACLGTRGSLVAKWRQSFQLKGVTRNSETARALFPLPSSVDCDLLSIDRVSINHCWHSHSWDISGRGTTRAEDAQETPTQSHISPSILVYEEYPPPAPAFGFRVSV